jgi:pimeloyl-ACP methyl ester carboxylesterase
MESHHTTVRGLPLRWEESGEGVPVVLIHGIPTAPALWRHVVPLVHGVRCLAFEMVGYGDSIPAGRDRDISVARQAAYLLGWLEALGVDRAVYVGHDLGGGVAQIAAVRQPDRCAGLLLTNAISYDSWPIPSVKAMQKLGPALHRLPDAVVQSFLRMFLARGHQDSQRGHEAMELYWPMYARHGAADALARQVRSLRTADTLASRTATPACRCRPASCGGRPTGNDLVAAMS